VTEDDMSADSEFPTKARPVHRPVARRPRGRFAIWAWSQVRSFQVGLTGLYVALVYFGVMGVISAPPSIDSSTPGWYVGFWAAALIAGAGLAALGSVSRRRWFERAETAGSFLLSLTVGSYALILQWYAFAGGDWDKAAAGAGFTALTVPLLIRLMWLLSQSMRK
jgi:hypothetical protein